MELWTLRRENKGARSKNSPGIDPCRPSDFFTQVWGSLFKAPLYSPNNNKCIDTGLTSGPPWGDGAEEAGEQQEQGHLSDPVARNRVEIPLTLFFLCSFFKYLGKIPSGLLGRDSVSALAGTPRGSTGANRSGLGPR